MALIAVSAIAVCSAPAAIAAPPVPPAVEPVATPAISWSQLGLSNTINLVGSNQPTEIEVPVPQGVGPAKLTGSIGSIVNATGRVDVFDSRGVLLGSIAIPTAVATAPFVVDLSQATTDSNVVRLSFVIHDKNNQRADSCSQLPSVTLRQLSTTFAGPAPNPSTVADFLPGYLNQITILVGPNPTQDQQQAALTLVAKLTQLYRPIPTRIDVDTSPAPGPAGNNVTSRTIAIRAGDKAGLTVENPGSPRALLAITGKGPALLSQVELFADRRFDLAQTASAAVTSATPSAPESTDSMSFRQLGVAAQASVIGTTTLYIGFDAAKFAVGQIDNARVHLIAKYTPVSSGDGSVLIKSGNEVLASRVLDASGVVDLSADIPAPAVTSNVGLALEVRYIPEQECAPLYNSVSFVVDPASTVKVSQGSQNRGGFPVLPMAFTPDFDVALANVGQLRYAAMVINLMGQQSTVTLRPNVTTLGEAAKRSTGLLTVGTGAELAQAGMQPPLLATGHDAVDINGTPVTGVDVRSPLGVIQAFSNNGRTVLAVDSSGDRALLDRSFDYIRGLENRWGSLTGDVVATGASSETVNLTVRAGGWIADREVASDAWKRWTLLTAAVGAVVILAVGVIWFVRRRRTGH
ncbi:hypothetical protein BH09ACT8_BH09ACT8_48310 [soil metagenome]